MTNITMKYYAFDWDDNVVHMPTKIILKDINNNEFGISTEDFAKYRHLVGKKQFDYYFVTIVGYAENPFRYFRPEGDDQFLLDAQKAKPGPAFPDFVEAINNGSIISIITARGHTPSVFKDVIRNYINSGFNGINKTQVINSLRAYQMFMDEPTMTDDELLERYLNLNKYYPVSYQNDNGSANPEQLKVMAMDEFIQYVKNLSHELNKKFYIKNDISNNFIPYKPTIGFSDDDIKNVEIMNNHYSDKKELINIYSTNKGTKEEYIKNNFS